MNEKIRELAIKAKLIASEYNGFDQTRLSISQQKFAELIVRECADICWNEDFLTGNGYAEAIEHHFGVKQ